MRGEQSQGARLPGAQHADRRSRRAQRLLSGHSRGTLGGSRRAAAPRPPAPPSQGMRRLSQLPAGRQHPAQLACAGPAGAAKRGPRRADPPTRSRGPHDRGRGSERRRDRPGWRRHIGSGGIGRGQRKRRSRGRGGGSVLAATAGATGTTTGGAMLGSGVLAKVAVGGALALAATAGAVTIPHHFDHPSRHASTRLAASAHRLSRRGHAGASTAAGAPGPLPVADRTTGIAEVPAPSQTATVQTPALASSANPLQAPLPGGSPLLTATSPTAIQIAQTGTLPTALSPGATSAPAPTSQQPGGAGRQALLEKKRHRLRVAHRRQLLRRRERHAEHRRLEAERRRHAREERERKAREAKEAKEQRERLREERQHRAQEAKEARERRELEVQNKREAREAREAAQSKPKSSPPPATSPTSTSTTTVTTTSTSTSGAPKTKLGRKTSTTTVTTTSTSSGN